MKIQKKQSPKAKHSRLEKELEQMKIELERKNHELEIEAALEKVRAVAMGMRKPGDLLKICRILFSELRLLGFRELRNAMININDDDAGSFLNYDYSDAAGATVTTILYNSHPATESLIKQIKESKDAFGKFVIKGKELDVWRAYRKGMGEQDDPKLDTTSVLSYYFYSIGAGSIGISTYSPITEKKLDVLKRYRNVFFLSYQRYIDITKAEAQTKEAQIEASLERVRAVAMSMLKSDELLKVCESVFNELRLFGFSDDVLRNVQIVINNDEGKMYYGYQYSEYIGAEKAKVPYELHPVIKHINEKLRLSKDAFADIEVSGAELEDWKSFVNNFPQKRDEKLNAATELHYYFYSVGIGALGISTFKSLSAENLNLLQRLRNVFNLSYQRYNDIKLAEEQVREAQIEASLERVRAKAMAMHNSSDLSDAAGTVFTELNKIGINLIRSGFVLLTKESRKAKLYPATSFDRENTVSFTGEFEFTGHPVFEKQYESWQKKENYFPVLEGEVLKSYYKILSAALSVPYKNFPTNKKQFGSFLPFTEGFLFTWSDEPYSEKEINILERFKAILDLTIRRYLDLKNAEAQAREAKIEAALERVRSKAMAMHKSDDLNDAVAIVFDELEKLNLGMLRCGIGILSREKRCADVFTTTVAGDGRTVQVTGDEAMDIHPLLQNAYEAWLRNEDDYSHQLEGQEILDYYRALTTTNFHLPESQQVLSERKGYKQFTYHANFQSGALFAFRETPFPEEAKSVMKRFASVFNLTYQRFLDIQNAEAQAREALIEVALERVRSRTLAMQRSDELAETAAVLFRQLITLGIEPNRLYIGIIKDDSGDIEAWATDENGGKVSTMFTLNAESNASVKKMFDGWKAQHKSIIIDMHGQELKDYFHYLSEDLKVPFNLGLSQKRRVQNIAYFSKGFIGLASPDSQPEATTNLLERFASVFNLTYTRFNDLQIAEQHAEQAKLDLIKLQFEKKRAENALTELRTTQAQLIQSEKMASLGELTAGIAHEIKNPLNFVNNFSDLSTDLVDEFINTTDESERKDLAEDLKKNLIMISEHGRRADSIVKNMLEHSRSGSGKKQPTDINQLCTEFFNLAYHGNRANIPDFNCEMKKDLAPDLPQINVVPQDISRVLLNLFNNAFYAVNAKNLRSKVHGSEKKYNPTVELITKLSNQQIIIMVRDNGNGIPNHIKEKIFEPFFTTKPAGQGTGLGLSLSYDIITNGHSGELKVESKEGEGSTFIIHLSVS